MRKLCAAVVALVCLGQFGVPAATVHAINPIIEVSSKSCQGPGSMKAAVELANSRPGADVISILSTAANPLHIDWNSCPFIREGTKYFAFAITESVTILGNHADLNGQQGWIDQSGIKSPLTSCPGGSDGTFIVAKAPGLFEVGVSNADNSAITVDVRDLNFHDASRVAKVQKRAHLSFTNVTMSNIVNIDVNCLGNAIQTQEGAQVTLTDSRLVRFVNPGYIGQRLATYGIIGGAGTLNIVRTYFGANSTNGVFNWGGTVNVVSSQFVETGGFYHYAGTLKFVNSTYYVSRGSLWLTDRVIVAAGSNSTIEASSFTTYGYTCDHACVLGADSLMFDVNGGTLQFRGSAVGNTAERAVNAPMFTVENGGTVTADTHTWMQPTALQDAAALRTLTGQAALLTDAPGLLHDGNELLDYYPKPVLPLLGSVATPGVLIDAIPDANTTNLMLDPITGLALATDVFGNPRVDANTTRNIGAAQTLLAPHLELVDATQGTANLAWTQPRDPVSGAITGYHIWYRVKGDPSWSLSGLVNGPASLVSTVNGLTNGLTYQFKVTGVNGSGDGPDSNVVEAKVLGAIQPPPVVATPGNGQVQLTWTAPTDSGGYDLSNHQYYIVWYIAGTTRPLGQLPSTGTSIVVPGLTNGTNYEFCVFVQAVSADTGSCNYVPAKPMAPAPSTTLPATTTTLEPILPSTGSPTGGTAWVALLFVLTGGLVLFAVRRRTGMQPR